MREKRRTRTNTQAKTAVQTTLKDLFRRTFDTGPIEKAPDIGCTDEITPSLRTAYPQASAQPRWPPGSSQLYPIFTKVSSVRDRLQDPIIGVVLTNISSDAEVSSSSATPRRSECSQASSRSLPPPPIDYDVQYYKGDTNLWHASIGEHIRTHPHWTHKTNESNQRTSALEDIVPLPSSCSQHVRGVQYSYACDRTHPRRITLSSLGPTDEGTLDFLAKWRQPDDAPSTPWTRICHSLTSQQCKEYLQSFSCNYTESHPAFAQISIHQERQPLRHAEMWTRRFRPRRANEVLGNERHAIYLRDWLRALELRLQDPRSEGSTPQLATYRRNKVGVGSNRIPRGTKRPRVIRAVTRNRGNKKRRVDSDDDLDDFVVFSDADDERQIDGPLEDSEDELEFCRRTLGRLHGRGTANADEEHDVTLNASTTAVNHAAEERGQTKFADSLTNTLLITGPPGCGKTAAVYACAEELGWEIFEVYPGIGRRNGVSLDHLVGDVGKNHIVQTVHRCERMKTKTTKMEAKKRAGLSGYLAKGKAKEIGGMMKSQEAGTEDQPINVEDDGVRHEAQASNETVISGRRHGKSEEIELGPVVGVRQSLVLLEEVDILFKEDVGFWPAVIEFIRSCQRPVVMTCNDASLVPVGELPIQKVLVFEPCSTMVAASFLQCLSLTKGCLVPHEDLVELYERRHSIDGMDVPEVRHYPRTEPVPLPDLRRCITELEIACTGARQGSASEKGLGEEAEGEVRRSGGTISAGCRAGTLKERELWREMRRKSEVMSYVDGELWKVREGVGTEGGRGEEDEEVGYVVLREEERYCRRDELIAEEAIRQARGVHEGSGTGPMEASINPAARLTRASEGFRARVAYQTRMEGALQGILEPPAPLMPQRSVFLDYIPWVRYMVGVDDQHERRTEAMVRECGGRGTRNSMGARYARGVGLGEEERVLLTGSGLVDD